MTSPTFVAVFADGESTRMTTFHDLTKKALDLKALDLRRGIRLSLAALPLKNQP